MDFLTSNIGRIGIGALAGLSFSGGSPLGGVVGAGLGYLAPNIVSGFKSSFGNPISGSVAGGITGGIAGYALGGGSPLGGVLGGLAGSNIGGAIGGFNYTNNLFSQYQGALSQPYGSSGPFASGLGSGIMPFPQTGTNLPFDLGGMGGLGGLSSGVGGLGGLSGMGGLGGMMGPLGMIMMMLMQMMQQQQGGGLGTGYGAGAQGTGPFGLPEGVIPKGSPIYPIGQPQAYSTSAAASIGPGGVALAYSPGGVASVYGQPGITALNNVYAQGFQYRQF